MASKKPKGLGRGLDALFGTDAGENMDQMLGLSPGAAPSAGAPPTGGPTLLPLEALCSGRYQPRTQFDEGSLYELAESIRNQGVMQPILVRRLSDLAAQVAPDFVAVQASGVGVNSQNALQDGAAALAPPGAPTASDTTPASDAAGAPAPTPPAYEIIAGERRWRAARLAGLHEVPVWVRQVDDQAAAAMALIENMQREDLNPLEAARGLQRLIREFGLTHDAAAQAVGRSRSAASNLLRLLNLAEPVQTLLSAGDLDMGHARALLALDKAGQINAANQVVGRKLSVRDTEALVRKLGQDFSLTPQRAQVEKPSDIRRVEEELADLLGASVQIKLGRLIKQGRSNLQTGELVIGFASLDALEGVLIRLRGGPAQ